MSASPDLITRGLGATDAQLFGTDPPRYRVYVRDYRYFRVAELMDWTSLTFTQRFNGVGTWTLETSSQSVEARKLLRNGGIIVTRTVGGSTETIFSGFVSSEWTWTANTFRAAGLSDDAHLRTVLARPVPSQDTGPYAVDAYVDTGLASTVMRELVSVMCGPDAPGLWNNVPIVLGDDPLAGATVTVRGNLQPVMTILQELAADPQAGGLGFRVVQSDTQAGSLEFQVFEPVDRSAQAKFSVGLNTISDYEDNWSAPDANYAVVLLGDGYGANRTIVEGGDADSVVETGRRMAAVIDLRGSTDTSEGEQALAEFLAGVRSSRRSTITPFDVASLRFGVDYDFGDLVTVVTHGGTYVDLIRAVQIDLDPARGAIVTPMVGEGTGGGDETERTARYIATVQDRLSNLERNWTTPPDSVDRSMLVSVLKPPIGEVKWLAGASVPSGYLAANGQAVSRATYASLFAEIGTVWGAGNGTTTFNVPDLRDRSPIGTGSSYSLGQLVGADEVELAAHSHSHSHAGGTLAWAHTHPGSHSHGAGTVGIAHDHNVNIDHNHASFDSGYTDVDSVAVGHASLGSGATDHKHPIDVPALGTTNVTSGAVQNVSRSGSTDTDSNVFSASATGGTPWSGATGTDSTGGGGATIAIVHPSAALTPVIYAGV